MSLPFSPSQNKALVVTERVNSCVSVAAMLFVFLTYWFARGFDKPINRLIYYASFGNLGSNIAALISSAGPLSGTSSGLCQFQAFLVQMFLGVDCYWALFMAINVYLVFFKNYTVEQLKSLDILYLLLAYGLSLIPALVFIFISTAGRGRLYGDAIIWCWISVKWDFMRVVFLYAIVWVAFIAAFVIYGMAARVIYHNRDKLEGYLNPLNETPFGNVVTEIKITHDERPIIEDACPQGVTDITPDGQNYNIQIEADGAKPTDPAMWDVIRVREITKAAAQQAQDQEAWLYARIAFMFFLVLLITWIPTSVNRVYTLVKPNAKNFGLNYASSFVFPLQGFWNSVIYVISSQSACRRLFSEAFGQRRRTAHAVRKASITHGHDIYNSHGKQRLQSISSWGDEPPRDNVELDVRRSGKSEPDT
ncbi:G protein coupled receptor family protein [Penicillium chermesinum]|uniref:G protein coupled receptor family protein n=1 Tax=Penicillium chermesinum TaxID=63820 RepID=A0A9W9NH18_9EURO|nr:G protein coupled receptor family protein [Penicillium chermesinum]KAJ5219746.1 G protein coupled receptor family protein [Penicillium chermesinum]KAJ6153741.1 G protein coupled receptor family protein [Penicillium chermesinum]